LTLSNEYLAGLFDSEGSIAATPTGRTGLTVVLLISNTYLPVLHEVRETLGYGYIITQKPRSPNHNIFYEWRTRNHAQILDFIGRVEENLRIKREAVAKVAKAINEHKYNQNAGTLRGVDQEFLQAFHEIMPLREVGRMLGVHPKSIWRQLPQE
jgi:hypothetical protein